MCSELSWAPQTPRRGRPTKLTRDAIVDAAMTEGLESLTMRQLATRLGVSHSTLYGWVTNREELLALVSDTIVDRVLPARPPSGDAWQEWLSELAWAMHDEFLALPGFATHVANPHEHHAPAYDRLSDMATQAFQAAGATAELATHSWHIFSVSLVSWLAAEERTDAETTSLRFDLFLASQLRGLPATEPGCPRPATRARSATRCQNT